MTLLTVMLTTATAWAATENLGGHNFTVSSKLHSGARPEGTLCLQRTAPSVYK